MSGPPVRRDGRRFGRRRRALIAAMVGLLIIAIGVTIVVVRGGRPRNRLAGCSYAAVAGDRFCARLPVNQLKIMNYFPAADPGALMWRRYSHQRTDQDFAQIAGLGANTVRVIVPGNEMGFPQVTADRKRSFDDLLTTAAQHRLSVQLTLFDSWNHYDDIAGSKQWLSSLLAGHRDDRQIALVELQNEIKLNVAGATNWAQQLLPELANVLPGVPRTLSVPGSSGSAGIQQLAQAIPRSDLDVIDAHVYTSVLPALQILRTAKQIGDGRPVIVGETGQATQGAANAGADIAQARYLRLMAMLCQSLGLPPPAPWVFTDFNPTAANAAGYVPTVNFGLRRVDGTFKPAAQAIRDIFGATPSATAQPYQALLDGNFENENGTPDHNGVLGAWTIYDAHDVALAGTKAGTGRGGGRAGFLNDSKANELTPSLYQTLPLLGRSQLMASAWVRLDSATGGAKLRFQFYDADQHYLSRVDSSLADLNQNGWQQLRLSAAVPAGAAAVQIHLTARGNQGTVYYDDVTVS